jgi:hypothetical protein
MKQANKGFFQLLGVANITAFAPSDQRTTYLVGVLIYLVGLPLTSF